MLPARGGMVGWFIERNKQVMRRKKKVKRGTCECRNRTEVLYIFVSKVHIDLIKVDVLAGSLHHRIRVEKSCVVLHLEIDKFSMCCWSCMYVTSFHFPFSKQSAFYTYFLFCSCAVM